MRATAILSAMRLNVFVALLLGTFTACSKDDGPGTQATTTPEPFVSVSFEEGGFCGPAATAPCWVRTVVAATSEIKLERYDSSLQNVLAAEDLKKIRGLVDSSAFRTAVAYDKRQCPNVFDADAILTFVTASETRQDKFAGGCVFRETVDGGVHPYRDLYLAMTEIRQRYFPGAIPVLP
jgi:hypothetical protein